jgi:hypothetical protein
MFNVTGIYHSTFICSVRNSFLLWIQETILSRMHGSGSSNSSANRSRQFPTIEGVNLVPWRLNKRYSIIDQHLVQHFKNNSASLLSPPPFLCKQIITPFSHLMLSANQERGLFI